MHTLYDGPLTKLSFWYTTDACRTLVVHILKRQFGVRATEEPIAIYDGPLSGCTANNRVFHNQASSTWL